MRPAPWTDVQTVRDAVEMACAVRDYDPHDIAETMTHMGPRALSELAVVLAAMVDVDAPTSALYRWTCDDFLRPGARFRLCSSKGRLCVACERRRKADAS